MDFFAQLTRNSVLFSFSQNDGEWVECTHNAEGEAEREERRKKENEAQKALRDVIKNQTGEDYLDLDLHQEKCFIQQYLALLQSVSNQVANK